MKTKLFHPAIRWLAKVAVFIALIEAHPQAAPPAYGYVRRHCPWVAWMKAVPSSANQLPASLHQPFTAFPGDFAQLPTVAFVIPSNLHNMHDTGIADGDLWLSQNLSAYAAWARTHNS